MYDFHYKYILPKFPCANLLFTDIDSFCYKIPVDTNIYQDIKGNQWFDFSNYPKDHPNFDVSKKLKPGFFKDLMGGKPILEFVGLRAMMYSILKSDGGSKSTAKGVNRAVKDIKIKHEDYKQTLFEEKTMHHNMPKIMQKEHELFTADVKKTSLSPFNDKQYITSNGDSFTSYSFGHYKALCLSFFEEKLKPRHGKTL